MVRLTGAKVSKPLQGRELQHGVDGGKSRLAGESGVVGQYWRWEGELLNGRAKSLPRQRRWLPYRLVVRGGGTGIPSIHARLGARRATAMKDKISCERDANGG